jgi:transcriptional regulator with XRE-family HTH domain
MWLENLKELKQKSKKTYKDINVGTRIPTKTIERIFNGTTESPTINTLIPIISFLGGNFSEVFADTQAVVGNTTVTELQENVNELQENVEVAISENDLLSAENKILQDKVSTLEKEIELLKMKLMHKEELLAVHNYYTKLKCE